MDRFNAFLLYMQACLRANAVKDGMDMGKWTPDELTAAFKTISKPGVKFGEWCDSFKLKFDDEKPEQETPQLDNTEIDPETGLTAYQRDCNEHAIKSFKELEKHGYPVKLVEGNERAA